MLRHHPRRVWQESRRMTSETIPLCPLCLRPLPGDVPQSRHHLVPKLKGGAKGPTVLLHAICHKEIHARFTEAELARGFSTIAALRADPRMAAFLSWIARRPPGFTSRVPGARRG
jgi:hypothetical protein